MLFSCGIATYRRISGNTIISTHFVGGNNCSGTADVFAQGNNICCFRYNTGDTNNTFYCTISGIDTADHFKYYLAQQYSNGTPVVIYFVTKTPVDEEITDLDTIEALETIYTYTGITYIDCEDNLQPVIKVDYLYDNDINNYYGPRLDGDEARIRALERQISDINATLLSIGGNV